MSSPAKPESFAAAASALEFPKVLQHLSNAALSTLGANEILHLQPLSDLPTVQTRLAEITEMRSLLDFDDAFP
ncbi:hypothetical protein FBQ85_28815, partial [Cytophagia bacterium CHB2]|nr:hypothetical protein [Cytophagia bacterium CHB2]